MICQALTVPLVAVVTPVYNGAAFLGETMDCVQAQTYGNIVHVLLDNASTDETAAIIERYRDRRVPLVVGRNPETLDVRDNWEAAVRSSPREARYFLVLCADDLITPDAIEKLVALAEQDLSIGIVACLWTKGADPSRETEGTRFGLPADISVFDGRWFVKAYLMQLHLATSPPCQLIRRDILDEIDPFYSSGTMMMDIDACLKVAVRRKVGFVYARLGFTRIHGGRITDQLVQPGRMYEANWLALIDRYGPGVMGGWSCRRAGPRSCAIIFGDCCFGGFGMATSPSTIVMSRSWRSAVVGRPSSTICARSASGPGLLCAIAATKSGSPHRYGRRPGPSFDVARASTA